MAENTRSVHRCMVAVWPGMGNVGLNAGVYLLANLEMQLIAEIETGDLFDIEYVEVRRGILRSGRRPLSRFFQWTSPDGVQELVVFVGEAQPPAGKYAFCKRIVEYAQELGIERIYTFAAMATDMHPQDRPRVFAAGTDADSLRELQDLPLEVLRTGHIGGLNGVLVGAAADSGMRGACLLGEMPQALTEIAFPKASLAILDVFRQVVRIELDLSELSEQAVAMDEQIGAALEKLGPLSEAEEAEGPEAWAAAEEESGPEPADEPRLDPNVERRIETLFAQAQQDRSKAFELKQELDRWDVFRDYEDRFLDLFRRSG